MRASVAYQSKDGHIVETLAVSYLEFTRKIAVYLRPFTDKNPGIVIIVTATVQLTRELKQATFLGHGRKPEVSCFPI